MRFTREQVLAALRGRIDQGRGCAGSRCRKRAGGSCGGKKNGADLIIVYNSGRYRMNGIASIAGNLPIGDANAIVQEMGQEQILPLVRSTPVVAGIYGVDPTRDMRRFLEGLADIGYSGVINFPTVGKLSGPHPAGAGAGRPGLFPRGAAPASGRRAWLFSPWHIAIARRRPACWPRPALISSSLMWGSPQAATWGAHRQPAGGSCRKDTRHSGSGAGGSAGHHPPVPRRTHRHPAGCAEGHQATPAVGFVAASSIERLPVEGAVGSMVQAPEGGVSVRGGNALPARRAHGSFFICLGRRRWL